MKTLFENLLFNHRFVFQDTPKPQPTEAETAKVKPEETAGIPDKDFDKWFDKETEKTKEKGKEEEVKAKKDVAALDIDKYIKPEAKGMSKREMDELATKIAKAQVDKIFGNIEDTDTARMLGIKTKGERKTEEREETARLAKKERDQEKGKTEALARLEEMDKEADKMTFQTGRILTETYMIRTENEEFSTSFDKLNGQEGLGKELVSKIKEVNKQYADDPLMRLAINKEIYDIAKNIQDGVKISMDDRSKMARNAQSSTKRLQDTINKYIA